MPKIGFVMDATDLLVLHEHTKDRIYSVVSDVFYVGLGEKCDGGKVQAYPLGGVIVPRGNTSYFQGAKSGEYIRNCDWAARPRISGSCRRSAAQQRAGLGAASEE
jgi:hypothetical protein